MVERREEVDTLREWERLRRFGFGGGGGVIVPERDVAVDDVDDAVDAVVGARTVLVRKAILAARSVSWSSLSVCGWAQRHAVPCTYMPGRALFGYRTSRHSVLRNRLGRAGARGVHDILVEGSS